VILSSIFKDGELPDSKEGKFKEEEEEKTLGEDFLSRVILICKVGLTIIFAIVIF
jgi:hypothetical protein